jgi:hypothetical protein
MFQKVSTICYNDDAVMRFSKPEPHDTRLNSITSMCRVKSILTPPGYLNIYHPWLIGNLKKTCSCWAMAAPGIYKSSIIFFIMYSPFLISA